MSDNALGSVVLMVLIAGGLWYWSTHHKAHDAAAATPADLTEQIGALQDAQADANRQAESLKLRTDMLEQKVQSLESDLQAVKNRTP